jgi:hypothetical protein
MIKPAHALLVALALVAAVPEAWAFPEMERHGYVNCTSCHVSPSGGGALTEYGRHLSADVLSTWSYEGEGDFLHGAAKLPDWLAVGGDLRAIEIFRDTPQTEQWRFLAMQADAELAFIKGPFTLDASVGTYMITGVEMRRFYAMYKPLDELAVRFGRFQPMYGLMDPDHTTPIHRGLGWDEGTESYNVEASWLGENWNAYATAVLGQWGNPQLQDANQESGVALRGSASIAHGMQVGASYFHGSSDAGGSRDVFGPFGILGFTPHFFLLTEFDFQFFHLMSNNGWVNWNRLDYELVQGLHAFASLGITRGATLDPLGDSTAYGPGIQFFPRPHFEFLLQWLFQRFPGFPSDTLNYGTFLMHYYF